MNIYFKDLKTIQVNVFGRINGKMTSRSFTVFHDCDITKAKSEIKQIIEKAYHNTMKNPFGKSTSYRIVFADETLNTKSQRDLDGFVSEIKKHIQKR